MEGTEGGHQALARITDSASHQAWALESRDFTDTLSIHLSVDICKQHHEVCPEG